MTRLRWEWPPYGPRQGCWPCYGMGYIEGDYDGLNLRCYACGGTGYTVRPGWRIYRPRRAA